MTETRARVIRKPGALRGGVRLRLETEKAQRLLHGRRAGDGKPMIVGLMLFAAKVGRIWEAAAQDDPYADWWLLDIEHELQMAKEGIAAYRKRVRQALESAPSVDIAVAVSLEPVEIELRFGTPYGFMGSYLLADYDQLVREALTARHVALMDREATERLIQEGGRAVRRAFNASDGYRYLGLTREDVRQGTAKARKAKELMGEVPAPVVEGRMRARHAPPRRRRGREPEAAEASAGGGGAA